MPATSAASGFGTLLKRGDGGTPTEIFTTLLENIELNGPALTRETIDATNQESPSGFREYLAGLADGGEVSGTGNYIEDTTQASLRADLENGTKRNFQLVVPFKAGSKTWSLSGFVTSFAPTYPVDDKMTYAFAIKLTGKPTLA